MDDEQQNWHLIGWDGITVRVPPEWDMGAISREEKGGYLRADDQEMPRLEIKWHSSDGFVDMEQVVSQYLKQMQRSRKRGQQPVHIEREVKVISRRKVKKDKLQTFAWHAEQDACGAAWLCRQCGRVVIAQVMGPAGEENLGQLAEQVIATVTDHPTGGWKTWAAYNFVAELPEDFELKNQKLRAGLIEFSFERDTEKATVACWGMANVALRRRSLKEWAEQELGKALSRYGPESEPIEHRGHPALAITGKRLLPFQGIQRFFRHVAGRPWADQLRGYVWHCEPENKIYVVYAYLDHDNYDLAEQIRDRIVCHQKTIS